MGPLSEKSKIYVGKLPEGVTDDSLRESFARYGRILEVMVAWGEKPTGNRKDYGFVWFADEGSAKAAIDDVEEHVIMGTKVEVKEFIRRTPVRNGNQPYSICGATPSAKKIFVGGLPYNLTVEEFRAYFGSAGETTDVVIIVSPESRIPRGFGFVTYASEESARRVLERRWHLIQGKIVEVKAAIPKVESNPLSGRDSNSSDAIAPRNGMPPPPQPYYSTNGFLHSPYGWTNGFLWYWEPPRFDGNVLRIGKAVSKEVIIRDPIDGTRIHLPPRPRINNTGRPSSPAHPPPPAEADQASSPAKGQDGDS